MLRSLLRASAALAFAALVAPAGAAPAPGLAYDEIVRVVVNATPPPPGNFQADVAALNAPSAIAAASPSAAPARRGGINLGRIAQTIAGGGGAGDVAGAVAVDAVSSAMENAIEKSMSGQFASLGALAHSFLTPHLMRYAYWNGWERVEDVTDKTATIRKCDAANGQVIHLNLAAKTYTVYDPSAEPTPSAPVAAPPAARRGRSAPAAPPDAPGTTVLTLSETTRALGAQRFDSVPASGYDSITTVATSQSTGSCRDGSASIETTEYLPQTVKPTVKSCPVVRREPVPTTATEAVTPRSGGCRPTLSARRSGPALPTGRLSLYSLVRFSGSTGASPAPAAAGSGAPGGIGFLTERGNVKTLPGESGLFSVPAGFTKSP